MKNAILQVDLDLLSEHRGLAIAKESVKGGADWLEAGTPLIKTGMMHLARKVKKNLKKVKVRKERNKL